jgi:hypothetical protein
MAKVTSDRTSLVLDDEDEGDRQIIERQRLAARDAGRAGRDRAGSTGGRPDLEFAFDAGANEPEPADLKEPKASKGVLGQPLPSSAPKGKGKASRALGGAVGTVKALPSPTLKPPRSLTSKDLSGFALGLVLHALIVSYIRYGKAGPKSWMSAKFLNRPLQGDELESENRKDSNTGVDPEPSGRGPNGEVPAEGHMDDNTKIY